MLIRLFLPTLRRVRVYQHSQRLVQTGLRKPVATQIVALSFGLPIAGPYYGFAFAPRPSPLAQIQSVVEIDLEIDCVLLEY